MTSKTSRPPTLVRVSKDRRFAYVDIDELVRLGTHRSDPATRQRAAELLNQATFNIADELKAAASNGGGS